VPLVGADVAHLERHGRSRVWSPNLFWLAACARTDMGQVSPHLLDRFALRIDAASLDDLGSVTALRGFLAQSGAQPALAPDVATATKLKEAAERAIDLSDDAIDRVLTAFTVEPGAPAPSPRRSIALAWLAVALARLDGRASRLTT